MSSSYTRNKPQIDAAPADIRGNAPDAKATKRESTASPGGDYAANDQPLPGETSGGGKGSASQKPAARASGERQ